MACPYFREEYVGFCTAMNRPYVPSIAQMEQHCFKAYGQCWAFRDDARSAPVIPYTLSEDTQDPREQCPEVTLRSHEGIQQWNSWVAVRHRLR